MVSKVAKFRKIISVNCYIYTNQLSMKYLTILLCLFSSFAFGQIKKGKIALGENISLIWEITPFAEKEHKLQTCDNGASAYICTIDALPWYGSDRGMDKPKNQLTKFILIIDGKYFYPEISGMYNPNFSGALKDNQIHITKQGDEYSLDAWFSDGAGTYMAKWRIVAKACIREIITNDEAYFGL